MSSFDHDLGHNMPKTANEVYRLLASQKHGIPQFTPDPNENLPDEYRAVGVSIGDVGIWRDGSFEVLFNTCQQTIHSINSAPGVPEGFTPFPLRTRDISRHRSYHSPGSIISSAKISQVSLNIGGSGFNLEEKAHLFCRRVFPMTVGGSITFNLRSKAAAILVLPDGASRENLIPAEAFRAYVRQYSRQWYAFAQDCVARTGGSLFVVTGCDKATSWRIATASATSAAVACSLKYAVLGVAEGTLAPQFEWQDFGSATVRTSSTSARAENQCIFIRGLVVPRRFPAILTSVVNKILLRGLRADIFRRRIEALEGGTYLATEQMVSSETVDDLDEANLQYEEIASGPQTRYNRGLTP
ncbi:hypothetical protein GGX14DRAFT_378360 [Mycena pura]|uniref:Uncharacterized protein n=1 Tax=Mycena pura TaxID=153505 RepID=A0AAD6Y2Y8_9AGAR|nr:hypothetical protein GGX14DRAFT_378360 [Mycena pura]